MKCLPYWVLLHYFFEVRRDTYWVRVDLRTHATLAANFGAGTHMFSGLVGAEARLWR